MKFLDRLNSAFSTKYKSLKEINFSDPLVLDFFREFKEDVSKDEWKDISMYQKLSEDFIREFKDKVGWYSISKYQTFSEDFAREFKDRFSTV